ncbi:MAG TPA: RNA-directed DNA polymerase [Solirubrobacteraceae bacterium]
MPIQPRPRWSYECNDFVEDLGADRMAAWVPDVAGDVDMAHLISAVSSGREPELMGLVVPRPDGGSMTVPVLHPAVIVQLHRAVLPLRKLTDRMLAPGVVSYRRGADRHWNFSPAWRSFTDKTAQLACRSQWVVFTDVASFFDCTPWSQVLRCGAGILDRHELAPLRELAERLSAAGLAHLPSGYSDARLLGNLVLGHAERGLTLEFLRWVDDYRLFAHSERQAHEALACLSEGLSVFDLKLNLSKTRIVPGYEAAVEVRDSFVAIFNSEVDSSRVIHEKLIGAFRRAAADPVERRRELRYSLAVLTREHEPAFIDWAFASLWEIPWEAPRLVSYLASVSNDPRVASGVDRALGKAAQIADPWRVCRLAPLAMHTGAEMLSNSTLSALLEALPRLAGSPAWGLALRTLSRARHREVVERVLADQVVDVRAALVALRDLDLALPASLCALEPALAEALRYVPAPLPPVRSML